MKVLLCLLSDQHVPNLLSVHHFKPDRLVLIESTAMQHKEAARHFREALQIGRLDFTTDDRCLVQPLDAEDNLDAVRSSLQQAFRRYPPEEWIANLSGGTKPMSIATYEFFKAVGARLVYVNFQKPDVMLGMDGRPAERCEYRPTLREFLAGYGFELTRQQQDLDSAEDRARSWFACATQIALSCPEQLLCLGDLQDPAVKKRWDEARRKGLDAAPGQIAPTQSELRNALTSSLGLRDEPDGLRGRLDKHAVQFLTGGWLEFFLWGLLERHAEPLGVWDVRLGLQPRKIGATTGSEFDVAFMHDYRLSMIECKSGSQEHDPAAEALHKVEAVVRQFRALGIRSYLATTSANVLGQDGKLKPGIRDRSVIYQCRILVSDEIRELARKANDAQTVRELILGETSTP
jgi:hypothetical protein